MSYKEIIKKYQGNYYLGYEINDSKTYLFIKKIPPFKGKSESSFMTYSDVILSRENTIVFEQNREWYFGTNFIDHFNYKKISKSSFLSVLNQFGLNKLIKDDKEYHTDFVSIE